MNRNLLRSVAVAIALLFTGQAAQAKTFGWKATGKGGVVYVIGSVHVLSKDFYPLNAALEAFEGSAEIGCIIVTGACPGLPHAAVLGAHEAGGASLGVSPAHSREEHVEV